MGGKKMMKLPSIFRNRDTLIHWPSCTQPSTLSFRLGDDIMFKTVNSVFFDNLETPDSLFTSSSESRSFSSESDSTAAAHQSVETIIRGVVRSDRLFFNPGHTSSILEPNTKAIAKAKAKEDVRVQAEEDKLPFKESVALAMESEDPYVDFKKSMEEMVESHGLKDWECLEELLGWYLKMNGKMNHGYIVGAFVDLLVRLGSSPSSTSTTASHESTSFSSAASSFASPPPSSSSLT